MGLPVRVFPVAVTMCLAGALLPTAGAQEAAAPATADAQAPRESRDVRASRVIGRTILGENGWQIGEVDDLVVDPAEGLVKYLVLTAGSRFEAGEEELAVALPDERLQVADGEVRWRGDLASLRDLPWIHGQVQGEDEEVRKRLTSARALIGAPLAAPDGERLGRIEDLVVDLGEGRLRFAVADHDRSWRHAGRRVALPSLDVTGGGGLAEGAAAADGEEAPGPQPVTVRVEPQQLASRATFEDPRWPALSDSHWRQRLERLLSPD